MNKDTRVATGIPGYPGIRERRSADPPKEGIGKGSVGPFNRNTGKWESRISEEKASPLHKDGSLGGPPTLSGRFLHSEAVVSKGYLEVTPRMQPHACINLQLHKLINSYI